MLLGVTGKSAQIPLFVWLPDAMAGPTPVSALIHAATMVTAGVYLMVRSNVFFAAAPFTSLIVTLIGTATALVAGYIAIGQWDIKRCWRTAPSASLGFMVAAVGVGAYGAAMFHLVTHAFFKALLFLGSGSVIHGVEHGHHDAHAACSSGARRHTTNTRARGRIRPAGHAQHGRSAPADADHLLDLRDRHAGAGGHLPVRGLLVERRNPRRVVAVAVCSNNNVGGYIALGGLLLAAGFTAFYMWRQVVMVFHGDPRTEAADHAHESPPTMTIPLIVLALLQPLHRLHQHARQRASGWTTSSARTASPTGWSRASLNAHPAEFQPLIALGALAVAVGAIFLAGSIYGSNKAVVRGTRDPLELRPETGQLWSLANARMYWDRNLLPPVRESVQRRRRSSWRIRSTGRFWHDYFHDTVLARGFNAIARLLSQPVDLGIIDGVVNGVGWLARWISGRLRRVQTGYVRTYAITILLGVVVVIIVLLLPLLNGNG